MKARCLAAFAGLAGALLLAGCVAGPDYRKPATDMPAAWSAEAPWKLGQPADAEPKGPWWQRFNDPVLDGLAQQAIANSPTLALANARLAQSRASLAATSASLYPQVGIAERVARQKSSANRPLSNYNSPNFSTVQNDLAIVMTVGYEADLAGRVQRSVEGAQASVEQVTADLENVRLLLTADLATAYFTVRALDAELDVLARSIALQRRALELVSVRHELGAGTGLDVAQQQALLDTTLVQVDVLRRQRSQFEHALATLAGIPAPQFTLAAEYARPIATPPPVPTGVPSDVLERRPDIAAAERAMAAANAQIGVASAAYYPSVLLGATGGLDARTLATLFDAPSLLWSIGVSAAQILFDGGRINANVDFAKAGYAATVANYRRIVLVAMQEVEDGISGGAALERAVAQARVAEVSARRVLEMSAARYEGGASAYLDVIAAQQAVLTTERQATQLQGQRLLTSVFLIKALGGDWHGASYAALPAPAKLSP